MGKAGGAAAEVDTDNAMTVVDAALLWSSSTVVAARVQHDADDLTTDVAADAYCCGGCELAGCDATGSLLENGHVLRLGPCW